jgi:hypothetical protein
MQGFSAYYMISKLIFFFCKDALYTLSKYCIEYLNEKIPVFDILLMVETFFLNNIDDLKLRI